MVWVGVDLESAEQAIVAPPVLQSVARESNVNVHPHYEIFNGLLLLLLALHIYW